MNYLPKHIRVRKIHLLLALGFIVFLVFNYRWLDLATLQLYSMDDYAFHGMLRQMYDALTQGNIRKLIDHHYYNYGFSWFLLNELVCFPFLASGNTEIAIFLPRMLGGLFALISIFYIYLLSRLYLSEGTSLLISFFIMSMPAFWRNATWFHPDWAMCCFIIICIYYMAIDQYQFGKYYRRAVVFLGIAIGVKFQAVTFLPIMLVYIFYHQIILMDFHGFFASCKRAVGSLFFILLIYLIMNPFMLHPQGYNAFMKELDWNMVSNASNHFSYIQSTISGKLHLLDLYYFNFVFTGLLIFLNLFLIFRTFITREKTIFFVVAVACGINLAYLFFVLNKGWLHYYLSVMVAGTLILIPFLHKIKAAKAKSIMLILCLVQIMYYSGKYPDFYKHGLTVDGKVVDPEKLASILDLQREKLANNVKPGSHILLSYTLPLDQKGLGVPYENVFLCGILKEDMIDSASFFESHPGSSPAGFISYEFLILDKVVNKRRGSGSPAETAIMKGQLLTENLKKGEFDYVLVGENERIYIFKRKTSG